MWGSLAAMRVGLTVAELLADVKSQEHPCEKQGSPGSAAPGALLGGTRVRESPKDSGSESSLHPRSSSASWSHHPQDILKTSEALTPA